MAPKKLDAATLITSNQAQRKTIEEEDRSIYLSSLSALSYPQRNVVSWDKNWDKYASRISRSKFSPNSVVKLIFRREPEALIKPLKDDATEDERRVRAADVEEKKPKAKRTLILVRHGQYNMSTDKDSERYLTELGRQQADITGKRLADLIGNITLCNEWTFGISLQLLF